MSLVAVCPERKGRSCDGVLGDIQNPAGLPPSNHHLSKAGPSSDRVLGDIQNPAGLVGNSCQQGVISKKWH